MVYVIPGALIHLGCTDKRWENKVKSWHPGAPEKHTLESCPGIWTLQTRDSALERKQQLAK